MNLYEKSTAGTKISGVLTTLELLTEETHKLQLQSKACKSKMQLVQMMPNCKYKILAAAKIVAELEHVNFKMRGVLDMQENIRKILEDM